MVLLGSLEPSSLIAITLIMYLVDGVSDVKRALSEVLVTVIFFQESERSSRYCSKYEVSGPGTSSHLNFRDLLSISVTSILCGVSGNSVNETIHIHILRSEQNIC